MSTTSALSLFNRNRLLVFIRECTHLFAGSFFIVLCSQIKIPLSFTPVPLSLQTLAFLIVGGVFGYRKAGWMTLAYFAQIAFHLPVLAGGVADALVFAGPRAGYIIGFLLQAYGMGWCVQKVGFSTRKSIFLCSLGLCLLQLGLGSYWLSYFIGANNALYMGFYPFVIGEVIKSYIAACVICRCNCFKNDR
jgi:biotin transport system substrate-specific component